MSRGKLFSALTITVAVAGFSWVQAQSTKVNKISAEDYVEILNLYNNYAHSIDAGQGERFAATWTEDGEFTHGYGPGQGSADRTPAKGTVALTRTGSNGGTRHFVANLVVTPSGDGTTAKASCYLLLYSARTVPPSFTETAIYDDTLVRTPQGWKFKKRIVWRDDDDITPFKPKPQAQGKKKE